MTNISLFDLFSIGIGPSSSHTVGPMLAANAFLNKIKAKSSLENISRVKIELYGSLALTGKGHGTDIAILNGLEGKDPETVMPSSITPRAKEIIKNNQFILGNQHPIKFNEKTDLLLLQKEVLPKHTNGMRFSAYGSNENQPIVEQIYYSIGGGFIVTEEEFGSPTKSSHTLPYPFGTANELLALCKKNNLQIWQLMLENEKTWRNEAEIKDGILNIANVMLQCIETGCKNEGILPGGLNVKRRAPELFKKLQSKSTKALSSFEHTDILNYLNMFAMAVNEENAAGGRIVTAPTNGAAGIIPAILKYFQIAYEKIADQDVFCYFLTAAAIGILYKKGASISGAEVGCQGEVGVASSMAAGALTAVLGGELEHIENAAEIAMEHHLGMTCDPVMGLVQVPCIERNAMGSVKAVNAARLSLQGDGQHIIPLDKVIRTMRQTGIDMQTIYKETSLGGLAVNIPEC